MSPEKRWFYNYSHLTLSKSLNLPGFLASQLKELDRIISKLSSITKIKKFYYSLWSLRLYYFFKGAENRVLMLVGNGQEDRDSNNLDWILIQDLVGSSPIYFGCERPNKNVRNLVYNLFLSSDPMIMFLLHCS